MAEAVYDRIGVGYAHYRQPDRRIAERIREGLGPARSVLNVGAGTGSYEPADRRVIAIEPSAEMVRQRKPSSAQVIRGIAERLPLRDGSVDAAMAVLTMHHWEEWRQGLAEMRRVARERIVLLTWDPDSAGFWLTDEYFPEIIPMDREIFPSISQIVDAFGTAEIRAVPIPHDCTDGFLGAYWRRPERYLDPGAQRAISAFSRIPNVPGRLDRLARELQSGAWQTKHRDLLDLPELDLGYRLVIAGAGTTHPAMQ